MNHRPSGRMMRCVSAVLGGSLAFGVLAAPAATAAPREAIRPTYLGKTLYTGEFHSHTSVSDGVQTQDDAFAHVRDETQADFFALSEHDVMWDLRNGDDYLTDWRDADSQEWRDVHEKANAFNTSQDDLVAVPAIENTWYDGTGHINVFNTDWKATARATEKGSVDGYANSFGAGDMKYDMYTFFARLKQDPDAIGQFNHPSASGKGRFFGFNGLDREVDDRMELIEVRNDAQFDEYVDALDTGWHVSPTWNGDEHSATWVSSNQALTGVWAKEHTLDGLYAAMKARSTYSTLDSNAVLAFSGNDTMMGSILPADTSRVTFAAELSDPDARDSYTSVELISNGGRVVHTFSDVTGRDLDLSVDQDVSAGDYYLLRATQADGQTVTSAPVWIGDTTRGANYAPKITIPSGYADSVRFGQQIALPKATATDDSGVAPDISYEVYDSAGKIAVDGDTFRVRGYDDTFVVVKAKDAQGNIGTELIRLVVDQDVLDPAGVFRHFGSTAAVTEKPGGTGIAVSTDRSIPTVYAQILPADEDDWSRAAVVTSTNDKPYEVNAIGNDEEIYQQSITGQTLRSHEFDFTGLSDGSRYRYRFGVAVGGKAPSATDTSAWTATRGKFAAGGGDNRAIYAIGDLQATSHEAGDLGMLRDVLDRLEEEVPGGGTLLQTGDLVDNGGRGQYWGEVFEHAFDGLEIQYAPVAGNHETYGDLDYNSLSAERNAVFSNMFDTPKNGAIGESNYSFDRGDVHIAVLNSVYDMDKQIDWLAKDIRASDRKWNIVTGHYSYYGGSHGDDGPLAADRPKLTAAFDRLGVDLYIGGHDHIYKRSTIYDGRLAVNAEEEAEGTTFVTLGSAGPKFYDNVVHWWDDVVFDEDTQLGTVLQVEKDGLKLKTYTIDGRVVDDYTVRKPQGTWRITSTEVENREMQGVGVISNEGSPAKTTLMAATYDSSGRTLRDVRQVDVSLDHQGSEQFATFKTPLPVNPSDTVKVFAWDSLAGGRPMKKATVVREGIQGLGTAADPYLLSSGEDLAKIANDPEGYYKLTKDLDLSSEEHSQIDRITAFKGVFDGGGHTIKNFTAPKTQGVGLFADNRGTIRNLAVEGHAETDRGTVGLLADQNHGVIERVRTAGSIAGTTRVGGIVGDHYGTIQDSYSTADATSTGMYVGGVVSIAMGGSITTRVYSTGTVKGIGRNAGGVVSYGYENTDVSSTVSLNTRVQAPSFAHAIVGRVADGQIAELANNYTSSAVTVLGESLTTPPAADNWRGEVVKSSTLRTTAFFDRLGWDLDAAWEWNVAAKRPLLRGAPETIDVGALQPSLTQAADGFWLIRKPQDLAQIAAFPEESYRLAGDLDLTGSDLAQLGSTTAFSGTLDGDGHTISGLTSTAGGLFGTISADGQVHDLGLAGVAISKATPRGGALVDTLRGTVERVWASGEIKAHSYAGGIAGESFGTIRDAYSTAKVSTTNGNYAGGIVGVADSPSTIERVYATGVVVATGSSAGGVAGYARNAASVVRGAFALNPTVTGTTTSQRVVARFANSSTATLEKLFAVDTLTAGVQSVTATGPTTLNGEAKMPVQAAREATWRDEVGFDFTTVWAWNKDGKRPVLQHATEKIPESTQTEPRLERADDGTWLLGTIADVQQMIAYPAEPYRLTADLDLAGQSLRIESFSGSLDGAGHAISGLTSTAGGLFGTIAVGGRVHDLGLAEVSITKSSAKAGAVVDTLRGTVERVWVSGAVKAQSYAAGIAGESFGTIRDAYSVAKVSTTSGNYAGGIVGVADSPSTTERVYAAGAVVASGSSAGGVAGYARNAATVVRGAFALNPTVTGTATSQRVVARFASSSAPATLEKLYAIDTLVAGVQSASAVGPTTLNGETTTAAQLKDTATWTGAGFDLQQVWSWDADRGRPVLKHAESSAVIPAVFTTPRSAATVAVVSSNAPSHEAVVDQDGTTRVEVDLGSSAAEQEAGILVLRRGADPRAPRAEDIAFLGQKATDAGGHLSFDAMLGSSLAGLWLAVGAEDDGGRISAWLDADADPVVSTLRADDVRVVKGAAAALVAEVAGGELVPSGEVTFTRGETRLGEAQLDADGRAVLALSTDELSVGSYRIQVAYSGDGLHPVATTDMTLQVEPVKVPETPGAPELSVPAVTADPLTMTWGAGGSLRVRVAGANGVATGEVRVAAGGKVLAAARLVNGVATVPLRPRSLRVGKHALTVTYGGDSTYVASAWAATVTVGKATAALRLQKVSPAKITVKRTRAVVRVRVSLPAGVSRNGTVTVRVPGGKKASVRVINGVAKVRLPKFRTAGVKRLTVNYSGNSEVKPRATTVRLRVAR